LLLAANILPAFPEAGFLPRHYKIPVMSRELPWPLQTERARADTIAAQCLSDFLSSSLHVRPQILTFVRVYRWLCVWSHSATS